MSAYSRIILICAIGLVPASLVRSQDTATPAPPKGDTRAAASDRKADETTASDEVATEPTSATLKPRKNKRSGPAAPSSAVVREPSQGRPIFIMPGETFYFVMRLPPDMQGDVRFSLAHAIEPSIRSPLTPTTPPSYVNDEYCMLVLRVAADTPPGLYDLEVKSEHQRHYARRSVKVIDRFKKQFRIVHLSDMNIGDLTAPEFDDMLPREINLLAPEFIVATGNYTEWARARDDAASWQRVLKFFEKFSAPVFMLCGLHDHEKSFSRHVASKPIGTVDYGDYHGLLLLDHPGNPIDQDYAQLQWIDADLKRNRNKTFNFLAANSDELALLDIWRERGDLGKFIKEHKLRMFIVGGSTDWDYKEFAAKLDGVENFNLIRTHQSSTCMKDRATGFSHYRVIEVDGDKIDYIYPNDNAVARAQHSIPTGRLRTFFDAPNDGTSSRVGVTVQNALNQGFDSARVWLRIAKNGDTKPTVAPGRLVRTMDVGKYWACEVAIDLPDKGAVKVVAAADPAAIPPAPPIAVQIDGPKTWEFVPAQTDFGLSYFRSDAEVALVLTNESDADTTCWPIVRVNGAKIQPDRKVCPRLPIALKPGQTIKIPLVLNLRRVSPGPHAVQVHFLEDPLSRLHTFDILLAHASTETAAAEAPKR